MDEHRLTKWRPKHFHHELQDRSMNVPLCDVKAVCFLTWSNQAALTGFIQQLMKSSLPKVES